MEHYIVSVVIDGDDVHVVCQCGWESANCEDETQARLLYEAHESGEK